MHLVSALLMSGGFLAAGVIAPLGAAYGILSANAAYLIFVAGLLAFAAAGAIYKSLWKKLP